jgi:hypothetical protein
MRNALKKLLGQVEGKTPVGDLGIGGRIIFNGILREWEDIDWIHPSQGRIK